MEYTKGNWKVTKWASHSDIHISVEDSLGMSFIANCGNPDSEGTLPHNPDAVANANLIALSPRMFELLKRMVEGGWSAAIAIEAKEIVQTLA